MQAQLLPSAPRVALNLFPYQREAVGAIQAAYREGVRRPALSAATGSGKTIMFAKVIEESAERALVIAHRKEIIEQAAQKVGYVIDPADVGIVMADRNQFDAPVVVASIQTLTNPRRLARLGQFGLVVIDEAHHAASPSYVDVLGRLGVGAGLGTKALGVSATWDRADGLGMDHVFDRIVYTVGIEHLIATGHLADIRALTIETQLDTSGVPDNGGGDFNAEALSRRIVDSDYADTLAHAVVQHAANRISLVFAPNVRTADLFRDALRDAGIAAESVNGETPRHDRERIVADLRAGRVRAVVNCGVFTEGTDLPIVDCVVMGRPTRSRALYQQMAGRGLRRYPGKTECLILDLVGNATRLPLQTAASLLGRTPKDGTAEITSFRQWIAEPELHGSPVSGPGPEVKGVLGQAFMQSAQAVELVDRDRLAWAQMDIATFSLPAGEQGQVVLRQDPRGTYEVLQFGRDRSRRELGSGLDIGYAQGVAEAFVMEAGAETLVDPNATWRKRKAPATDKQRAALDRWRIPYEPEITKVEASDLLDRAITRANLRRKEGAA